jgi:hypothetical protein
MAKDTLLARMTKMDMASKTLDIMIKRAVLLTLILILQMSLLSPAHLPSISSIFSIGAFSTIMKKELSKPAF